MKRGLYIGIIIVVVVVAGWFVFNKPGDDSLDEEINDNGDVFQQASLEAVGDYSGSGAAESNYVNGKYFHSIEAELPDPPEDKFYEGWLVRKVPFKFISTGELTKNEEGKYTLEFTIEEDYTNYTGIIVTEETKANGLDGNPEAHVLEGDF